MQFRHVPCGMSAFGLCPLCALGGRWCLGACCAGPAARGGYGGFVIDATVVRAHQTPQGPLKKGGDQAIGRSRGGLTTKIHACVDALGNPVREILTAGNVHDIVRGPALIQSFQAGAVIADKGYDSDAFIETITGYMRRAKYANINCCVKVSVRLSTITLLVLSMMRMKI